MRKWTWAAAPTATHWAGGWWGPHAPATPITSCRCSFVESTGAPWPTTVATSAQANHNTLGFTGASLPQRRAATFSTSAFTVRRKPFVVLVSVPQSKPVSNWLLYMYIWYLVQIPRCSCAFRPPLWQREGTSLWNVKKREKARRGRPSTEMASSTGRSPQGTWPSSTCPSLMRASTSVKLLIVESHRPAGF